MLPPVPKFPNFGATLHMKSISLEQLLLKEIIVQEQPSHIKVKYFTLLPSDPQRIPHK